MVSATSDVFSRLPDALRQALVDSLAAADTVVALVVLDLDQDLRFRDGLIVLTRSRLVAVQSTDAGAKVQGWPLAEVDLLRCEDRGGLGTLEATTKDALLGRWHYTVGLAKQVAVLVDLVSQAKAGVRLDEAGAALEPEIPEAVAPETPPKVGVLFKLLRFARPHIATLIFGVLLSLATTAAGLVPPYLTWPLVDDVLAPYQNEVRELRAAPEQSDSARATKLEALRHEHHEPFARVPWYLGGMLAAALLAWVLAWAQGWVLARLSERVSADLRNTTYAHLHKLSLDYFSAKRTGDLVARISSDTDRICNFLSDTLMDFATDILMIAGTAVMLFAMDPVLALATLTTFPLVAWLTLYTRNRLTHGFLHGSRAWADMTSILADTIPGVRVVKAFAQEQREIERFRAANDRIVAANDRVNRLWTFFWPLVALLNQIGLLVAWALGAWRVFDQRITVGVLTAFLAYIARFYTRLESMTRMAGNTQRAAASAQRIFDVLDRTPSVPEPAHPVHPEKLAGAIAINGVSFRFGNRQVIDGVSLDIKPGEMIGLVGPTGAGKSTLLNLVCRFYDVSDGAVVVDGTDIRSFPVAEYRRNIGMVLQDPFLFYGTIADNIAYGRPSASREEIIAAAKAARAHEFILQLEDGYDSIVGERGQTLSGGERQRISIARALLIDPRILILDEATSSVDTQTERQIQEALDNLIRGRTTIAIAHRLSTLRHADRLVVLARGRIVEMGTHEELLANGGVYKWLYEAQARMEPRTETGGAG
ncbi:MAG: ABC transporter ATP-binding protein [Deltaproteobacteria bacterium]|nr:ABC transporter ATP-binding protein [Deltaproteobacteria bacterium]